MKSLSLRSALLAATLVGALAGCGGDDSPNVVCVDASLASSPVSNNGQNGNMFDVVAKTNVRVTGLTANLTPVQNGVTVEIYHRAGSHVGYELSAEGWTLAGSAVVDAAASGPTTIPVNFAISVRAGQAHAFYVTSVGGSVDYTTGTAVGAVAAEDANLQILEGTGNGYPFLSVYSPRVYIGVVSYETCQ